VIHPIETTLYEAMFCGGRTSITQATENRGDTDAPNMPCPSCGSSDVAKFTAEMIIHFAGPKNLDKPGVWIFPQLAICLDCGSSRFTVPESELALLAEGTQPGRTSNW